MTLNESPSEKEGKLARRRAGQDGAQLAPQ